MTRAAIEVPVLVAGGGPVGVTLAMDLARHGIESLVLESRRGIPPNPRCNTTNARSMELLRRLGCADAVRRAGLPPRSSTDVVFMTRLNGSELLRYERPTPAQVFEGTAAGIGADWPTPEPQHFLSQLFLEPVLREQAVEGFGVPIDEGWALESYTQDADGVTALAREVSSGAARSIRARYLVGADGAASRVRHSIGARLEGIAEIRQSCSVFVRSARLTEIHRAHPGWMYRFPGNVNIVAIDGIDEWLFHTHVPPGTDPAAFDPEPAMFGAVGEAFAYDVIDVTRWTSRAMVVNKWYDGRVFLAGDAAHVWIPMGGFGMNAGIGDATSLSWMLAGVLQNWLDPRIFAAYETERSSLGERVAGQANRWGADLRPLLRLDAQQVQVLDASAAARAELGARIFAVNRTEWENPGMQLGATYLGSPIIAYDGTEAPEFRIDTYRETSWPGARAPHIWRDGQPGVALFDQLGLGFTLLRIGAAPPSGRSLLDAARLRGTSLQVLDVPEDEAVRKYEGYGLVLVRPDQYVVWRGRSDPDAAHAAQVLDRVTGVLVPERCVVEHAARRVAEGFMFPESPRWNAAEGKLVFSDMAARRIVCWDRASGSVTTLHAVDGRPNGIGFLPDGRLVVASMNDSRLLVDMNGRLEHYSDLKPLGAQDLGDLCVDRSGRVYVDDIGARVLDGAAPGLGRLIRVDPDRSAHVVAEELAFPNGIGLLPGGDVLVLGLTRGRGIVQFRVEPDGALREARPCIDLDHPIGCDGLVVDARGGIWACLPRAGAVEHYDAAGRIDARVRFDGELPIACELADGGQTLYVVGCAPPPDGTTLFQAIRAAGVEGWLCEVKLGPASA